MILRNHGLLTCGRSVAEAFLLMQRLETARKVRVDFLAANTPLHMPSAEAMEKTARVLAPRRMARERGVAKPMLDLLVAMATLKMRDAGLYP